MNKDKSITLLYLYDKSRSGKVPDEYLEGYQGRIQTDGYGGYNRLSESPDIVRYGCWAHARRKLLEAVNAGSSSKILKELLELVGILYFIEDKLRENKASCGRIEYVRLHESLPILNRIKEILTENQSRVLPKSKLGIAVNYILNEWANLERYISDGNIPIDNNLVENAIRPFVVGRKNWLFYDTPEGAYAGAGYYSLIESLKANGIEPESGLKYIFDSIPSCKEKEDFKKLIPKNIDRSQVKPYCLPRSPCG
jgi:transposase